MASLLIAAEAISKTFDNILTAIPFEVDRPTGVLAVQEIPKSTDKRAFSWIGVSKILILQQRSRCSRKY
jgi:hypothetical protein